MSQKLWSAVDNYIAEIVIPHDPVLDAVMQAATDAQLPAINVAPNQGKLLYLLVRLRGAERVLELGTLAAYSTIWMARALPKNGRVVTVESDPKHAEISRANIALAGLSSTVQLVEADALTALKKLIEDDVAPFDFIFIDADKERIPEYFLAAIELSRRGTVIIVDNVVRKGGVIKENSEDAMIQGVRRFNELLAKEARVEATTIQTVGIKGHDGLTIAVVKDW